MEKICTCIKNIGVWHSLEKNETATMFFLKKPSLVIIFFFKHIYAEVYSTTRFVSNVLLGLL